MKLRDVTFDRFECDYLTASDRCAVRTMYRVWLWVSGDIARYQAIDLAVTLDNMRSQVAESKAVRL